MFDIVFKKATSPGGRVNRMTDYAEAAVPRGTSQKLF